jgi:hypothetical protein
MKEHGANVVRRIHGDYRQWTTSAAYRDRLEQEIQIALNNDLYYLLDWARWDGTEPENPNGIIGLAGMPKNLAQWTSMWVDIYRRFKQYPNFLGNIANEPHTERYTDGVTVEQSQWFNHAVACVNAIANEDPTALIFVPFNNWAHDGIDFINRDLEAETGHTQLGWTAHVYRYFTQEVGETQTSVRNYMTNHEWIAVQNKNGGYPLIVGEFGANGQNPTTTEMNFVRSMLAVANNLKMGYTMYSWKPRSDFPMFVGNDYGTADWRTLSPQGLAWKQSIIDNPENGFIPPEPEERILLYAAPPITSLLTFKLTNNPWYSLGAAIATLALGWALTPQTPQPQTTELTPEALIWLRNRQRYREAQG